MSVVFENEDVNSISLTVVSNLLSKYSICPDSIGRLEVGTETLQDRSKSVKTFLMPLFGGNTSILGVDCLNACYGGTAALLNAVAWMDSREWDGRLALVVTADVAVYEAGSARPTGGVGAVAMLIGPNAPLALERGTLACHGEHTYDFYKPNRPSPLAEYPVVDGRLSIRCYMRALDACYARYCDQQPIARPIINHFTHLCFHAPYAKLVRKAHARLFFNDFLLNPQDGQRYPGLDWDRIAECVASNEDPFEDRHIEQAFLELSEADFRVKTAPGLLATRRLGNLYCASLYAGLASLISKGSLGLGQRIGMFSYGSGSVSSLFTLTVSGSCRTMEQVLNLSSRLDRRQSIEPAEFEEIMKRRESIYMLAGWSPKCPTDHLLPGTFYLTHVDDQYRRFYACKFPVEDTTGGSGISDRVSSGEEVEDDDDAPSC